MPIIHLITAFRMAANSPKVSTFGDFLVGVNWLSWNFPSITTSQGFAILKESICETHVLQWMYTSKIKVRVQVPPWLLPALTEVEGTIWHLHDFFLKRRNYSEELLDFPQLTSLVTGSQSHKKWGLFEGTQKEQSANSKNGARMWRSIRDRRVEFWFHTLSGIEIWVFRHNC